jgi:hypothetical protein
VDLPLTETTEGVTGQGFSYEEVDTDIALEFGDNILDISSVDSASLSREVVTIG